MENEFSEWMVVKDRIHKGALVDFKKIQAGFKKLIK